MNDLISLILFTLAAALTPGPNNIMIMSSGMNFGIRKSIPHYLGICIGFPIMALVMACGLGAIFNQYHIFKLILKILGSIYILYLALKILISTNKSQLATQKPLSFLQATLFQWINPKAWLMGVSAISIYTMDTNYFFDAVFISLTYFLIGLPCVGAWLFFGKFLQQILTKDIYRVWFNIIMAAALIASIGIMLI